MPEGSPILDYASPRSRSGLRLPARSQISLEQSPGRVKLVETLSGKSQAIGGLAFGVVVLIWVGLHAGTELYFAARFARGTHFGPGMVLGLFWVAEVVVGMMVIQQTWRRTTLEADGEGVRLEFSSAFKKQRFEWPREHVLDVLFEMTGNPGRPEELGQVVIQVVDRPVILFSDHYSRELKHCVEVLCGALGMGMRDSSFNSQ